MNKNLEEILTRKKDREKEESQVDWNATKEEWIKKVSEFYKLVEDWLKPYVERGLLASERVKIKIQEEFLGEYEIEQLIIKMPNEEVKLVPVGRMIFGALGRIDMHGNQGTARFLLVGKDLEQPRDAVKFFSSEEERKMDEEKRKQSAKTPIESVWKFATPPPRVKYCEMNADIFSDLFSQVING